MARPRGRLSLGTMLATAALVAQLTGFVLLGRWARARAAADTGRPAAEAEDQGAGLTIDVARDGALASAGRPISLDDLRDKAREATSRAGLERGKAAVSLRIDGQCPGSVVNRVLGRLQAAGLPAARVSVVPASSP